MDLQLGSVGFHQCLQRNPRLEELYELQYNSDIKRNR